MLDDDADLALLDQHLIKTNLLSQRMTSILAQLDSRLSRLDKTIAPLGLQKLTAKVSKIESAIDVVSPGSSAPQQSFAPAPKAPTQAPRGGHSLEPISTAPAKLAHVSQGSTLSPVTSAAPTRTASPADESALLTRGPDIMAIGEYFAAMDSVVGDLERMWKGYTEGRGGAREAGVKDLSRLVEIGFNGLAQLFLQLARDGSGRVFDPEALISTGPPTPNNYFPTLPTLVPISSKLINLLHPPPNAPTPKTEEVLDPLFADCIAQLAASRGDWMCRGFRSMVARAEEVDEGGIWDSSAGGDKVKILCGMWDALVVVIEAETLWIIALFPSNPPSSLLSQTLSRPVSLLSNTLQPVLATLKRSLTSHTFLALDMYASLLRVQQSLETSLTKCLSMLRAPASEFREILSSLNATLATLRSLVLRSFPEMLVDIRSPPRDQSPTSSIAEMTHTVLGYLEALPRFEQVVDGLLRSSHAERSWLMGANEPPSSVRSAAEEGGVVNLYVADVLGTLIIHLEQRARTMRKPIGPAFLLNNLSHIRNTTSSFNSDIIGPGAEDMLNKSFRDAKGQYISEWTALTSLLLPAQPRFNAMHPTGAERQGLKDASVAFFDRLAEIEGTVRQYPLSRQDPDLRDRVGGEVAEVVGGGYKLFHGRCQGKGLEKYLRMSPEELTRRVQSVFR